MLVSRVPETEVAMCACVPAPDGLHACLLHCMHAASSSTAGLPSQARAAACKQLQHVAGSKAEQLLSLLDPLFMPMPDLIQ